jgi:hypothetical protein
LRECAALGSAFARNVATGSARLPPAQLRSFGGQSTNPPKPLAKAGQTRSAVRRTGISASASLQRMRVWRRALPVNSFNIASRS